MANFTFTPNMRLKSINELSESWFNEWLYNFNRLDSHNHTSGKGTQIPTEGVANNAITQAKLSLKFYEGSWLTGTGTTTFVHSLGAIPHIVQLYYDDNGTIILYGDGSHIKSIDGTNITLDFSSLTVDSTHKLKINAIYFGS